MFSELSGRSEFGRVINRVQVKFSAVLDWRFYHSKFITMPCWNACCSKILFLTKCVNSLIDKVLRISEDVGGVLSSSGKKL